MGNRLVAAVKNRNNAEATNNQAKDAKAKQISHEQRINCRLSQFTCRLCLNYANGGVLTICGHLFCWDCLKQKVFYERQRQCPHCKRRLFLHEDIFSVYCEEPTFEERHVNKSSAVASVPRPAGMYLKTRRLPHWFMTMPFDETGELFYCFDRSLIALSKRLDRDIGRFISFLAGVQIICLLNMFAALMFTIKIYLKYDYNMIEQNSVQ